MARERKLTPEELALIKAQTTRLGAETAQGAQDSALKAQLAREQIGSDTAINASKIGLGQAEIGSKEKLGSLAAAIDALSTGSKESIAAQSERGQINSDLAKRGDIDQKTLATALAESGQPGLYNALARGNVDKRETAINSLVPSLQKANSDAEREKKIKPALDALGPGAYDEALARAYPKPENAAARAVPTPALFQGGTPAPSGGGTDWAGLANTLLGKGGATGTATSAPATPESRYVGLGQGSLEGSKLTNLEGGRSQLATPSGGTIGFNTPQTERRAGLLGQLIAPTNPSSVSVPPVPTPVGVNDLIAPTGVTLQVAPVTPVAQAPTLPIGVLPPPVIGPAPTPTPNLAQLLEMARQKQQLGRAY